MDCPASKLFQVVSCCLVAAALLGGSRPADAQGADPLEALPLVGAAEVVSADYLINGSSFEARAGRSADGREIVLDNGLVRRTWRLAPNGACVGYDNLMTGQSMLRSVRPEARVTIDGVAYAVGGLTGQPNHAYLTPEWLDAMIADPSAMRLVGVEVGEPAERFAWGRRRHAAPDAVWPPKGVYLRMDYELPVGGGSVASAASDVARQTLWADGLEELGDDWSVSASERHERTSFTNEGKPGEVYGLAGAHCFAERSMPNETALVEAVIFPGTDNSGGGFGPGVAWVFELGVVKLNLRPGDRGVHGQFELRINGQERLASVEAFSAEDGGLDVSQTYRLRIRAEEGRLVCEAAVQSERDPVYHRLFVVDRAAGWGETTAVRVGKMDRQGGTQDDVRYLGELTRSRVVSVACFGPVDEAALAREHEARLAAAEGSPVRVSVHYELYDGVPVMSKWVTVHNQGQSAFTVDRFTGEELALVEHSNWVEAREELDVPRPDYLHVETDFAFGAFNAESANRHVVHWRDDPLYTTQVNYLKQTPCLMVCEPTYGPAQRVAPGETFEGFRVFELVYDDGDRERRGLALKRMYRTVAPWVTENPITHHLLTNSPDRVWAAIEEAKAVGFEAIILSFGSGYNMENRDPDFLARWKEVADYAEANGIELGCYSLYSSRGAGAGNMVVSPPGQRPTHGQCPALTSPWGQQWLQTIRAFYEDTGFDQFENDGSYPGDIDITPRPPLQAGIDDSRWVQWRMMSGLYRDLRAAGVYMNIPDYYYLNGANKCGMGYREVNWSLPRAHQVIHTRQNIYDGTWTKTPSMGWMFVPLSEYQGGGAAATIEPLHQHLDHYERMMRSNLGMGVQAHYRGPRLYDTDETRDMVKGVVDWFKQYRDILESDIIHGRRADGRDLDWVLHVNPDLDDKGMLCVYNPLDHEVTKTIRVNLYYTGLTDTAQISAGGGDPAAYELARDYTVQIEVTVPAGGMSWYVIR